MIVIVQHKVRDYDAWKSVFDEHQAVRTRHGATGHVLYRGADDPNEVTVVNHFPSRPQADIFRPTRPCSACSRRPRSPGPR